MKERSRDIIEILADVVAATSTGCEVKVFDGTEFVPAECPPITYIFGNAQYLKDCFDVHSKSYITTLGKFPLIHLFSPFVEKRENPDYHSVAELRLLIACSTRNDYSNAERHEYTFKNVLRPIYERFIEALKEDGRIDFGYEGQVPHRYSENYSYGRYGAFTPTGEEVSEPIDAIVISNLQLKIKQPNCR